MSDFIQHYYSDRADNKEFYALMKNGTKEWIDPVYSVNQVDGVLHVESVPHQYYFNLEDIEHWEVRNME